ncbi:MAG: TonB-dependent receptor [Candidatus Solibacter usitatus]|nr:TonB-dependent receptor [Candidatus Solibacter usitatus]
MLRFVRCTVGLCVLASTLFGQGNTGSILGAVTDPSGAIVSGGKVSVTNVNTGVKVETITDSVGNYLFNFLSPGPYKVEAEVAGFKKFLRENINLEIARQLRIDIPLETGQVTETVNVNAQTPLLETETGTLASTVENRQVVGLPSLGRNPQDFRLLVPGVVLNRDGNAVTQGGLVRKDPYYIDGAHSSNHVWSGNPANPNPDVIQEFKVLTNSFSAEFGETSGAVMQSTTKSGGNQLHGTLFEFLRNDKLNAGNYYTHTRPIVRRNQYGGTVGGPILKNRTFFFFDIQYTKQRGTSAYNNLSVPTQAFRNGDFSTLRNNAGALTQIFDPATAQTVNGQVVRQPFAGNLIPAGRISKAAQNVQALYPLPQVNANFANYTNFGSVKDDNYEFDIKVDHNFSDRDKVFARYSGRFFDSQPAKAFPDPKAGGRNPGQLGFGNTRNPGKQAVVNHVHIFNPRVTNDLHLGWFQVFPKRDVAGYGVVSTNSLGILGFPNGDDKLGTPDFQFTNFAPLGSSSDTLFFELQNSNSLVNVTSWVLDRHTIKFGGEARQIRTDNLQPNPGTTLWNFQPIYTDQRGVANTGFDYASFLLGLPQRMAYRIFPGYFKSRASVYALFIQDDYRVNRKLTLNLGLRWDAPLWYHEAQDRSGVFDLNKGEYLQFGQNGFRRTPWNNNVKNFGPRIGFAYNPQPRLVVRGGYGVFSVGTMSSGAFGFMLSDPIFADADVGRYTTVDNVNWLTTMDRVPYAPADKTGRNALSVSVFPDHNPMSTFQQWNLNVQKEVGRFMFEVGYAGSKGTHLQYGAFNANAIPVALSPEARGRFIAPYVQYPKYPNGVAIQSWIGSSSYHSLQIKSERRFSGGLSYLAAFTFSKLIDVGQQGYRDPLKNRNLDRGIGPDSSPYRFTAAYTYELPFGRGRRWMNTNRGLDLVLGGWETNGILTAQAGFPLTPGVSFNTCVCGSASLPNVSGQANLSKSERTLDKWFRTEAFSAPALYTIGNAGRGLIWGPGLWNIDFTLSKYFAVTERFRVQLRAEAYNITNTPYFANPNVTQGTGTFGRVTAVSNSPRQVQMAMKLHF